MDSLSKLKDNFSIASLLTSNESCVSSNMNIEDIVDNAFKQLSNRNVRRADYFYIIAKYIGRFPCAQLSSIIDRIPSFIEAASNDVLEEDAFMFMFEELLSHSSTEVKDQLKKLLAKLGSALIKSIPKHPESHIGFRVLQLLARSFIRPESAVLMKQVCSACLYAVDQSGNRDHLSTTFAMYVSMESASSESEVNWSKQFNNVAAEGQLILMNMGIEDPARRPGVAVVVPASIFPPMKEIKSSPVRAVYLMERFLTVCALLKKMLIYGCSTGAVSLNLTALVALCPWLFGTKADVDTSVQMNYIHNNEGFSPVDISLVVSKMKIALIEVLTQLFALNPPSLLMYGQALHKPLATLSGQVEVTKVPTLKLALVGALSAAARCFPSIVAENMEGRSIHLLSWLEAEVTRVTALTSLVSFGSEAATLSGEANASASPSIRSNESESVSLILALIAACEQVLVHTAASLGPKVRQGFEDVMGRVLLCLSKGLVYPQYYDRKMHRTSEHCEWLRQSPELQAAFLRLGCTEVLCASARPGLASSNVSLLKRVAEAALGHPTTSSEAARTLLVVNCMQHPFTVALPAVAPVDLAISHINRVHDAEEKKLQLQKQSLVEQQWATQKASTSAAETAVTVSSSSSVGVATVAAEDKEQQKVMKRSRENEVAEAPKASAATLPATASATTAAAVADEEDAPSKKARAASPEPARRHIVVALKDYDSEEDDLPELV